MTKPEGVTPPYGDRVDPSEVSYEPTTPVFKDGVVDHVAQGYYYRVSDRAIVVWVLPSNYDPQSPTPSGFFALYTGDESEYEPNMVDAA